MAATPSGVSFFLNLLGGEKALSKPLEFRKGEKSIEQVIRGKENKIRLRGAYESWRFAEV